MKIKIMLKLFHIKSLNVIMHETNQYILISIYVFDIKNDIKILCRIIKKIHLIDDFKTHMFIKNDIVKSK